MTKFFQKKIEDFICENCAAAVKVDGYTNHCPACLYSKDVDVNPGDRAANCGGMMPPVSVMAKGNGYVILHRCVKCGKERANRASAGDNFDAILKVAGHVARQNTTGKQIKENQ